MPTYYDIFGGVCSHLTFRTDSPKEHSSTSVKGEQLTNEEVDGNFLSICKAIEALEFCCSKEGSCVNIIANYGNIGWESGSSQRAEDGPLIGIKGSGVHRESPLSGKGNNTVKDGGSNPIGGTSVDLYSCGDIYGECVPVVKGEQTPTPILYSGEPFPGFDSNTLSGDSVETGLGFCLNMLGGWHEKIKVHKDGYVSFTNVEPNGEINAFRTSNEIIRGASVTYGKGMVNGKPAFGVNWSDIKKPNAWARERDKRNTVQLVIVRNIDDQKGGFDAIITYKDIQWNLSDTEIGFSAGAKEEKRYRIESGLAFNVPIAGRWTKSQLSKSRTGSSNYPAVFYGFEIKEEQRVEIMLSPGDQSTFLYLLSGNSVGSTSIVSSSTSNWSSNKNKTIRRDLKPGVYFVEVAIREWDLRNGSGDFTLQINLDDKKESSASTDIFEPANFFLPLPSEEDSLSAGGSFPLVRPVFKESQNDSPNVSNDPKVQETKPLRISFCFEGYIEEDGDGSSDFDENNLFPLVRKFYIQRTKKIEFGTGNLNQRYGPGINTLGYWFWSKPFQRYHWLDSKIGRMRNQGAAEIFESYRYFLFGDNEVQCPITPEKHSLTGEYFLIGGMPVGAIARIIFIALQGLGANVWVDFKREISGGPEGKYYLKTQTHSVDMNSVAWGYQTCKYMPESCGPFTTTVDIGKNYKGRFMYNQHDNPELRGRPLFDPDLYHRGGLTVDFIESRFSNNPYKPWAYVGMYLGMIASIVLEALWWMADPTDCSDAITKIRNESGDDFYPQVANFVAKEHPEGAKLIDIAGIFANRSIRWYHTIIKRDYDYSGWYFPETLAWDWTVENGFMYQRTEIRPDWVTYYYKKKTRYDFEPEDQYALRGDVLFSPPEDYKDQFHGNLFEVGDQEAIENGMINTSPFKAVYPFRGNSRMTFDDEIENSFGIGCSSHKRLGDGMYSKLKIHKNGYVTFIPDYYENEEDLPRISPFKIDNESPNGSFTYGYGKYYDNKEDAFRVDWNVDGNEFQMVIKEDKYGNFKEIIFNYDKVVSTPSEIGIKTQMVEEWFDASSINLAGDNDLGGRIVYFIDKHLEDTVDDDDDGETEEESSDVDNKSVIVPGFDEFSIPEGSKKVVADLGFSGEFFDGSTHSKITIHRNGIVLLGSDDNDNDNENDSDDANTLVSSDDSILLSDDDVSLSSCSVGSICPTTSFDKPLSITSLKDFGEERTIVAPFFTGISETTSSIVYGQGEVDGAPAFGVTWRDVQPASGTSEEPNTFQLLFIKEIGETINNNDDSSSGATTGYSDVRLKSNIAHLQNSLEKLRQIEGVKFDWKHNTTSKHSSIGVIAQQIEPIFPELVSEDDKGNKSVNYNGLLIVVLEAIKSLSLRIQRIQEYKE